jgi:hypothetical protein
MSVKSSTELMLYVVLTMPTLNKAYLFIYYLFMTGFRIFFGYFISDKNRSVLFRDQLYVFWDFLYFGSVFDSVCFSPFFRFETGNQSLLDLNNFLDLTLASFLIK